MLFVFCNFLQFYISKNKFNDFCFLRIHMIIKIPFFILTSKNLSQIKREKNFFFKIISTHCIFTNPSLKDKKKKKKEVSRLIYPFIIRQFPRRISFYIVQDGSMTRTKMKKKGGGEGRKRQ